MHTEPLAFLENDLPARFRSGLESLRTSNASSARDALEDVLGAAGAVRIVVEGAGERWVSVVRGEMTVSATRPDLPVRGVLAVGAEAARSALEFLAESEQFDDPAAAIALSRVASKRAEEVLTGQRIEFHVIVTDLPDGMADVTVRCGVGVEEPPTRPQFTATISYDDIEDMRNGDLTPQQVIARLKLTGDASRAMALGMTLLQPPKKK